MKKILISVFLFSLAQISIAQEDYLVTIKSDTLKGKIQIQSYDIMDKVQIVVGKKKQMFDAIKVIFVVIDGETYKAVQYGNTIRMMKLLKDGYLSLYAFKPDNTSGYDGRYLTKKSGARIELPNLTFKKTLSDFLSDCESVSKSVKEGEYARKDIEKIVDDYNACVNLKGQLAPVTSKPDVSDPVMKSKTEAINEFTKKVLAEEFSSRNDAIEILKDIQGKVDRGENIPNYQIEALKSLFTSQEKLQPDLEKLIAALKETGK